MNIIDFARSVPTIHMTAICAMISLVMLTLGGCEQASNPLPAEQPIETRRQSVRELHEDLTQRVEADIPYYSRYLRETQAVEVLASLEAAESDVVREPLRNELREIATVMINLERHERRCREAMVLLQSAERELKRIGMGAVVLEVQIEEALAKGAEAEHAARELLDQDFRSRDLSGVGSISESQVEMLLHELRDDGPQSP